MAERLSAVLFDVFGTLLDVHSVALRAETLFPGRGAGLSRLWREKQLEYTRLRSLGNRYATFTRVTEDALQYAAEALSLPLDAAARGQLMHEYTQLDPHGDTKPALDLLRDAGVTLGVLSNGDPGLLEDALHGAQLDDYFDLLLSADSARAFKVAPAVYELGPASLGHPAHELLLVSANGWDAIGARWYGYRSFWVNRRGEPLDRLGTEPDACGASLADAANYILQHR